jgi:ferritin-like metal-binding protein YciE
MAQKTMNDLLLLTLQDVYCAERQILKALPTQHRRTRDARMEAW